MARSSCQPKHKVEYSMILPEGGVGKITQSMTQAALVAHSEALVSVERAMYQCGACGKLESRLAVTVKAPVRVPILQRCDCGATMRRIRNGKDVVCPACREPMQKTGLAVAVLWD